MTDDELQAIEARANVADAGPWLNSNATRCVDTGQVGADGGVYDLHSYVVLEANNREFIAHARQDIPTLIAEVRRLREAIYKIIFEASDGPDIWKCPFCLAEGNDPHADSCKIFEPAGKVK